MPALQLMKSSIRLLLLGAVLLSPGYLALPVAAGTEPYLIVGAMAGG